jgi:hypothetical protein
MSRPGERLRVVAAHLDELRGLLRSIVTSPVSADTSH